MHRGFIKLHRKFSEWEWYKDNNTKSVFLDLLINANYKESKYKGLKIQRGQIVVGRIKLADKLNFTEQQIRTALNKLKSTNEITIETTNRFSIVTLTNYELYQDKGEVDNQQNNQQANQQITNKQPTDNQQITTSKEVKKEKKEKKVKNPLELNFPESLNDDSFISTYKEWIAHKNEVKEKLTQRAVDIQLKKLSGFSVNVAIHIINASIERGWKGLVYDTKEVLKMTSPSSKPKPDDDIFECLRDYRRDNE